MFKRHGKLSGLAVPLIVFAIFCSLVASLLRNQATIGTRQAELDALQAQLATQEALNQELTRDLADGEDAIIERIAREQGYAQPNERIFVGY